MSLSRSNPSLHVIALLLAIATFPLIFIGGLVTSHGAGMAVPDWPNSYGYNMFLFPPSKWVGNIWYEHVHRLYASFIGLLSIVLCAWAWKTDRRKSVRWLTVAVLGAVIFQGVLGGLRVVLVKLDLAIVHGCFAQAFFCLTALTAVVTGRWWNDAPDLSDAKDAVLGRRVMRIAVIAVAVVYGQLVIGAVMRHYQAGLAIPDFPLAFGKILPPTNQADLDAAGPWIYPRPEGRDKPSYTAPGSLYARWTDLWERPVENREWWNVERQPLGNVWFHFAHRLGAIVVSFTLLFLVYKIRRLHRGRPMLLVPGMVLVVLLLTQVTLGALTVLLRKPADIASLHVACGALVLLTTFVIAVRTTRLYRPHVEASSRRGFELMPARAGAPQPRLMTA